jgi:alcohol dehydrogenase class IV
MMDASFQSGKAIQITRTTAAHAMSYQLTQTFGIAHGHACMLTLPELWDRMNRAGDMKPVLNHLSEIMRLGNPLMGPRLLKGILYDLEMEIPMIQDEETLDRLVDSVNPERLGNHPVALSRDDLRWIYRVSLRKPTDAERQTCLDVWQYYGR